MSDHPASAAAQRLIGEVANHRFVMQHAHDPDTRFADDIETVARALLARDQEVAELRAALMTRDGTLTVCIDCGNGWDSEDGEREHHAAGCVLVTPATLAGRDHSAFGCIERACNGVSLTLAAHQAPSEVPE